MSLNFLKPIGLSETESLLYELLLKLGEAPAQDIITASSLKRPTVYKALYSLEKKGLLTSSDKAKKIHFRPVEPLKLMEMIEERYSGIEQAKSMLTTILPALTSSYVMSVERPIITTYEGVEGLKKIYQDALIDKKEIFGVLQTHEVDPELFKWLTTVYVKERVKLQIPAKVIVSSGEWADQYESRNEKELRTTVRVPDIKFPFEHEVDIYGDKVAFINYKKGEKLMGVIIKNPQIARTMKAWFDLAWDGALTQK